MNSVSKRQLRKEKTALESLINRHGGDITLWAAHDNVAVALDLYRGAGARRKRKTVIENIEMEYRSWT